MRRKRKIITATTSRARAAEKANKKPAAAHLDNTKRSFSVERWRFCWTSLDGIFAISSQFFFSEAIISFVLD